MNRKIPNIIASALMVMVVLTLTLAMPTTSNAEQDFFERQQAGIRFGSWDNRGDAPPVSTESLILDIGDKSFYAELYGSWRLFNRGYLEVSLGFANRGDVSVIYFDTITVSPQEDIDTTEFFGNLVIYPVLVQFKYYFPGFTKMALKPYGQLGGGLFMGRHSVQFSNVVNTNIQEPSATKVSYVVGGGIDWQLSNTLGVEANVRYMPFEFGKDLVRARDYSALVTTIGVKYLFIPTKKKHGKKR